MKIKNGFISAFLTIIFITIFAHVFGKDPITYFKDSSLNIKIIIILFIFALLLILLRKRNK